MTPEWVFQILLAVVGILGSGAVWYFVSSKQYHAAIWVGFTVGALFLLVISLYLRNELLKAEESHPATTSLAKVDEHSAVPKNSASLHGSKREMHNPQLWITYAWEDDRQGDFQYLVQELSTVGVTAVYDKVALIPGQRLWEQIGTKISSGPFQGWAYLVVTSFLEY